MATRALSRTPIDFLKGHPNPSLLPIRLIKDAAQSALSDHTVAVQGLLYGPEAGFEPLRQELAKWLNGFYRPSMPTIADRICITGGASQNLGCILGVYTDPYYTRNIWIVAPAYFLAFRIFEDAGFAGKCRAVPEDNEGLDIDYLEREIAKSEEKARAAGNNVPVFKPGRERAKVYKHFIYCVPTFSNPSSRTMSLNRRTQLVKLAQRFDALVVSDDVYDFLQWESTQTVEGESEAKAVALQTDHLQLVADKLRNVQQMGSSDLQTATLPRLVDIESSLGDLDDFGHTCSNGSFSKIAGPGLRVGWAEGTQKFCYGLSQAGVQRSGGAPSQLTSTYIARLLETGRLQAHIKDTLQPAYASRYTTVMSAIEEYLLPLGFTLPQSDRRIVGGYFLWLGLPEDISAETLVKKCLEAENVIVIAGKMFEVPGDNAEINFPSSIRLCIAWEEETRLGEGVKRIARCAKELLHTQYVFVG